MAIISHYVNRKLNTIIYYNTVITVVKKNYCHRTSYILL